jgi:predicted amidohydrolase
MKKKGVPIMAVRYRVCAVQVETGNEPRKNLERVFSLIESVRPAHPDFIVVPEMFEIVPGPTDAGLFSRSIPDELTERLAAAARSCSANLVAGSIIEKDGGSLFNTSMVFDRAGALRGVYRKIHLFDAFSYGESNTLSGGKEPSLFTLDGLDFGIAICYDVRFPELFRHYALNGAMVVFVPAAFFQPNHDHWELAVRARALDNGIYVVGCCQTGRRFVGRSMAADPWGIAVASAGTGEGSFCVEIDPSLVEETRTKLPLLENRRFDVSLRG